METQEADSRILIGQRPTEDGGEEHVEELCRLAAGDEDDEFVVLRKLNDDIISQRSCQPIRSKQEVSVYLAFAQYESSQTHQSDLTGNHHHKLLQSLGNSKAFCLAAAPVLRGQRRAGGGARLREGGARHSYAHPVFEADIS